MTMEQLPKLIAELISSKQEGEWWDFKEKHHSYKSDLLHDVLCLANAVTHTDKYLIFGVNDYGECVGVQDSERCNQVDITDFFDKLKFLGRHPKVVINYYYHNEVVIGVLTIKDEPFKPFVLSEVYKKDGRPIPLGVVFNRTFSRNTPVNGSAKDYEIEKMWKERLNIPEKNRVIFWAGTYIDILYTLPVSLFSFSSLTLSFIHLETSALISLHLDIEALDKNPLLLLVGNDVVEFKYTEIYEDNVFSQFSYNQPNRSHSQRTVELRRISGIPK